MKNTGGLILVIVFVLSIVGIIAGVMLFVGPATPVVPINDRDETPIARVEGQTVTRFHLKVLRETERIKTEGKPMEDYGYLLQLIDLLVMEEILRRHGTTTSPDELDFERRRIDRETKEPEKLRRIKEYLAQYPGMFEMVMIRNNYLANNKIHHFQQHDRKIQAEKYKKAQDVLKDAQSMPGNLKLLERPPDVRYWKVDTREEQPKHPEPGVPPPLPKQMALDFANKYLKNAKPGEILPDVGDLEGSYVILRLIDRGPDFVAYENLIVQKVMYDGWYREQIKTLDIEVVDPELRDILKAKARGNILVDRLYPPPAK